MICKYCQQDVIAPGDEFCGNCGHQVEGDDGASAPKKNASGQTPVAWSLGANAQSQSKVAMPSGNNLPGDTTTSVSSQPHDAKGWFFIEAKSVPAFVVGLIAGLFGIMGGLCTGALNMGMTSGGITMILIPSIVGLVGACKCQANQAHIGSLLMFVPGITIIIKGWFMYGGAEFMSLAAMVLFWIAGALGILTTLKAR